MISITKFDARSWPIPAGGISLINMLMHRSQPIGFE
jgi:hypothetical protein